MRKKVTRNHTKGIYNLVLGFAGPYGAGCSSLAEEMERLINDWPKCLAVRIHVVDLIERIYPFVFEKELKLNQKNKADQRKERQKAGTELRKKDPEFVGKLICAEIFERGLELENREELNDVETLVFLIDSMKNSNEVTHLRRTYSDEFNLVFVHADRETRWRRMVDYKGWEAKDRVKFEERDQIDQDEENIMPTVKDSGQQVSKLSGIADYYVVNVENREELGEDGNRFLELLFGDSHNQPTIHEQSMHLAFSASNRSFCLSRQVGAAIVDKEGNLLAVGHNDVPKAFGGLYSQESTPDKRCYLVGDRRCINDTNKQERFDKLAEEINRNLRPHERQSTRLKKIIEKSEFREATEYCRAVHAEMEAILSVSRTGRGSTKGCTMYVTTEPCHNCIKHIVCAGLEKVYFMEPYPKSLGVELHSDAIELASKSKEANQKKVLFIPYHGVAPHRFHDFFMLLGDRKNAEGEYKYKSKEDKAANPRFAGLLVRRSRETRTPDPITLKESNIFTSVAKVYQKKKDKIKIKGENNG